jgi:hypothetical protein
MCASGVWNSAVMMPATMLMSFGHRVEHHELAERRVLPVDLIARVEREQTGGRAEVERLVVDAGVELVRREDLHVFGELRNQLLDPRRRRMEVELLAEERVLDDQPVGRRDHVGVCRVVRRDLVDPDARLVVVGDGAEDEPAVGAVVLGRVERGELADERQTVRARQVRRAEIQWMG